MGTGMGGASADPAGADGCPVIKVVDGGPQWSMT